MTALAFVPLAVFGQDFNGSVALKVQRAKFQDVEDAQAYYALRGSIRTSSLSAFDLELGVANIDNGSCGHLCRVSVDYSNIELNYKVFSKSRGDRGVMVEAGAGVSLVTLSYSVYQNNIKVADRYKNAFGLQAFAGGKYFFPADLSMNLSPYVGAELKYQYVESIGTGLQKVNLSNLKAGLELGVLF